MSERVTLHPSAAAALAERYREARAADVRLSDTLTGILAALGIDRARLEGFDDATGELLLKPPDIA